MGEIFIYGVSRYVGFVFVFRRRLIVVDRVSFAFVLSNYGLWLIDELITCLMDKWISNQFMD